MYFLPALAMTILSEPPLLVNRVSEMARLRETLEEARSGKGQLLFLAGEAGQGKTRLATEAERTAREAGFAIGHGVALEESPILYMVWEDALRGLGLGHVLVEGTPPRLLSLYLLTKAGLVAAKAEREPSKTDSEILGGMISAVTSFVRDAFVSMGSVTVEGTLARISHGPNTIMVQRGDGFGLCAIVQGRESEALIGELSELAFSIEGEIGSSIRSWSGNVAATGGWDKQLLEMLHSGRWDGEGQLDAEGRRWYLFDNVTRGLTRKAKQRPVLLVLDDLQWADPSSLSLLHYVSRNSRNDRILILGTYRTEEAGLRPHLDRAIGAMRREDLGTSLQVGPLPQSDARALISLLAGRNEFPAEFFETIEKETEGSPLYIREVLRVLRDEGTILIGADGVSRLRSSLAGVHIPNKVKDVVARRIAFLDKEERRVLNAAAVSGTMFSGALIAGALEAKELEVLERLQELSERHHLIVSEADGFRFDHPTTREVALNLLAPELRRAFHRGCARWLLSNGGDEAVIGEHLWSASDVKAIDYLRKAACVATDRSAHKEAIRYLERAHELSGKGYDDDCRVEIELATACERAGELERALNILSEVRESPKLEVAEIAQRRADLLTKLGRFSDAIETCRVALTKPINSTLVHATIERTMAVDLSRLGSITESMTHVVSALKLCDEVRDHEQGGVELLRYHCHLTMGTLYFMGGDWEKGLQEFDTSRAIAEANSFQPALGTVSHNRGVILLGRGYFREAVADFSSAIRSAQVRGDLPGLANSLLALGQTNLMLGKFESSREEAEKGRKLYASMGNFHGVAKANSSLALTLMTQGDFDDAERIFRQCILTFSKLGDKRQHFGATVDLAQTLLYQGNSSVAMNTLQAARATFGDVDAGLLVHALWLEALTLFQEKHMVEAKRLADESLDAADRLNSKSARAEALVAQAICLIVSARGREAEGAMKEAIDTFSTTENRFSLAQSYLWWARAEARVGDGATSRIHLEQAIRAFSEMGLPKWVNTVQTEFSVLAASRGPSTKDG